MKQNSPWVKSIHKFKIFFKEGIMNVFYTDHTYT